MIGVYADPRNDPKLNPQAVAHIALLARPMNLKHGDTADVHHMSIRSRPTNAEKCEAHIVGQIDGITLQQRLDLIIQVRDLETRAPRLRYFVMPHFHPVYDQHNGNLIGAKCSCVGLVVHAIDRVLPRMLLDHGNANYHETHLVDLEQIYPSQDLIGRHLVGLKGPGPWRVVLPGHLLHALKRMANSPPFLPGPNDYLFT